VWCVHPGGAGAGGRTLPTTLTTTTVTSTTQPTATPTAQPGHARYFYDGNGAMVKSIIGNVVTYYPSTDYQVKTDGTHTNTRKYYSFGGATVAMRENGVITWLLNDQVNSTTLTVNDNGTVASEIRYSAFGEVRYANGVTIIDNQYTGQRNETEIGLYYYVARYYDPYLAHFVQPDSIIPSAGNSKGYNRYAYSNNNPINYNDPSGHKACDDGNLDGVCDPGDGGGRGDEAPTQLSPRGERFIKKWETIDRLKDGTPIPEYFPYSDGSGYCTIGYGTNLGFGDCNSLGYPSSTQISESDADDMFDSEIEDIEDLINNNININNLTQNQYDALVSLAFNGGFDDVLRMKEYVDSSDHTAVANMIFSYQNDANDKYLPILDKRRRDEIELYFTADYVQGPIMSFEKLARSQWMNYPPSWYTH